MVTKNSNYIYYPYFLTGTRADRPNASLSRQQKDSGSTLTQHRDRNPEMSAKKYGTMTQNVNGKEKKTFVCQPWPKKYKM